MENNLKIFIELIDKEINNSIQVVNDINSRNPKSDELLSAIEYLSYLNGLKRFSDNCESKDGTYKLNKKFTKELVDEIYDYIWECDSWYNMYSVESISELINDYKNDNIIGDDSEWVTYAD